MITKVRSLFPVYITAEIDGVEQTVYALVDYFNRTLEVPDHQEDTAWWQAEFFRHLDEYKAPSIAVPDAVYQQLNVARRNVNIKREATGQRENVSNLGLSP